MSEKQEWCCPDCSRIIKVSQFPQRGEFFVAKMKHQIGHMLHEVRGQQGTRKIAEPAGTHKSP